MPDPSSVTAQQINTEVGAPTTTTQLDISGNNWVRNVAAIPSGAISYGNLRWGINFRGGRFQGFTGAGTYSKSYNQQSYLNVYAETLNSGVGAAARANLELNSNGVMILNTVSGGITTLSHSTWLTSGLAGDYTANFVADVASVGTITGSARNADLVLSTTRNWSVNSQRGLIGTDGDYLIGNLVITNTVGGAQLIKRPVELESYAERT